MYIKRGDVVLVDFSPVVGSEQGGIRPALVLQNDVGNKYSPTTIVAAMTTRNKKHMPTHVHVDLMGQENTVLLEQLRTISRHRIRCFLGQLSEDDMEQVDQAMRVSVGLAANQEAVFAAEV